MPNVTCTDWRIRKQDAAHLHDLPARTVPGDRPGPDRRGAVSSHATGFETSDAALRRHKEHLPGKLAKAHKAREVARADDLLGQVRELTEEAQGILRRVKTKDPRTALVAIREVRGNLELLAKLLGELQDQAAVTVNVLATPEWMAIQTTIVRALEPYPDARAAVAVALASITNGGSGNA